MASASDSAAGGGNEKQPVREAPKLSPLQIITQLVDTNPNWVDLNALGGCPFAWQKGTLYIADPPTVKQLMEHEWQLGSVTGWPASISKLLGAEALAVTHDSKKHNHLREVFGVMMHTSEVERMLPGIQATVKKYLAKWSAKGMVNSYRETLTLVFDILVNEAMQLGWNEADIEHYTEVFEVWNQGFTVIASPLPWSKFSRGMRARQELIKRLRSSLHGDLPPASIAAKVRDTYGADSEVCTDNLIMVIFAGFETTCSLIIGLLWHLSRQPAVLEKLCAEQKQLAAANGGALTLDAIKAMHYTEAAADEVLRLSQIVAAVPRVATKGLDLPRAPTVPSGCPMSVSWGGLSLRDPAVKGEETVFRPERWLEPANAANKEVYHHPFGFGQHDCIGRRVARAITYAVAQEVALKYTLAADAQDDFDNFPTGGRPRNGLPLTLKPL